LCCAETEEFVWATLKLQFCEELPSFIWQFHSRTQRSSYWLSALLSWPSCIPQHFRIWLKFPASWFRNTYINGMKGKGRDCKTIKRMKKKDKANTK
jgi:hypothetical protein